MEAIHALAPDIQGVLGQEFLAHFDYLLDFHNHRVVFGAAAPEGPHMPARLIDGRMAIVTSYGELVLDSGTRALVLFHAPAGQQDGSTVQTDSGEGAVSTLRSAAVRVGEKVYRPSAAAVAPNAQLTEGGLLPASLFPAIFICNSGHYVVPAERIKL